jgi:ABC-type Zn2+ transport system substrate-binding protein/surface adhesin
MKFILCLVGLVAVSALNINEVPKSSIMLKISKDKAAPKNGTNDDDHSGSDDDHNDSGSDDDHHDDSGSDDGHPITDADIQT